MISAFYFTGRGKELLLVEDIIHTYTGLLIKSALKFYKNYYAHKIQENVSCD